MQRYNIFLKFTRNYEAFLRFLFYPPLQTFADFGNDCGNDCREHSLFFLYELSGILLSLHKKSCTRQFETKLSLSSFAFSLQHQSDKKHPNNFKIKTNNNMEKKQSVIGIGEALFDVLPEGKKLGGAPANFAYHVSQFGLDSCAVSAMGKDELGKELVNELNQHHLNYNIEQLDYPTGTVQVSLNDNGIPCYDIKEGAAWDNIPFTPILEEKAKHCTAVCFGSLAQRNEVSRSTIYRFLDAMPKENGILKIFDINLRQGFFTKEIITESIKRCNILKINDEELITISRLFGYPGIDLENKCWLLMGKYNLKMLILTCGVNGSYVFTPGEKSFIETPKVEVADTVGAGDSFTGAFVASILKGKSVREAHELAVKVSAFVCTQNGAMPELPEEFTK